MGKRRHQAAGVGGERAQQRTPLTPGLEAGNQLVRQFTRTVAEMEWLVLLVAALYLLVARRDDLNWQMLAGGAAFAGFFTAFHYVNFFHRPRTWKLALETWVMIGFITWLLLISGGLPNPLMSLYLVVILIGALTLGTMTAVMELAAIGACLLGVQFMQSGTLAWSTATMVEFATSLAPMLLVAYLTSLLASNLNATRSRIQAFAETDPLTGLFNRRVFMIIAEHEYARALRHNEALSLLMVDVNQLKAVNDVHGHATGDALLRLVADTLQKQVRGSDTVARYAGDEFVALLPQTGKKEAIRLAARLRRQVAAARFRAGATSLSVSTSIGIATFPSDGATLADLLEAADQAMYRHKRISRRTAEASGHTPTPPEPSGRAPGRSPAQPL